VSADFSINADSSGEDKRPRIAMIARWNRYGRNGEWNARNDRTHASTVTTALRVLFSREKIMQAGSREGFDSTLSHHTFSPRRSRESQNVCRALGSSKSSFVFHRKRAARARKRERERERERMKGRFSSSLAVRYAERYLRVAGIARSRMRARNEFPNARDDGGFGLASPLPPPRPAPASLFA